MQKTIKKMLSLILMLAMVVSMFPATTVAAATADDTEFAVGSLTEAVAPGDEVTVPINVVKNPGIAALEIATTYDASVFEFVSMTKGASFGGNYTINGNMCVWDNEGDLTATGEILAVKFKVLETAAAGTYSIGINMINCSNYDMEEWMPTLTPGTITIAAAEVEEKTGYNNGSQNLTFDQVKADNYTLTSPGEGYYFAGWFKGLESAAGITKNDAGYYVLSAGTASGTSFSITESRPKYDASYDAEAAYHALWIYDDESVIRSMLLSVKDNVVTFYSTTGDDNTLATNTTKLLNETIQTVAGAGRIKLIKDMASYKLSNYKAVEETYIAPAIRMDMNGCTLTMTAENGECFSIHTRTENNLTQCIESSRGKGKITGTGGIVLDMENDTVMELRDLQITGADDHVIHLRAGTNLAKVERCDITLQSGSGAAIYVLGNSTYPATVGVIDGCTINSTGYLIQIDQKASTVGPISNTTMTGTGTYAIGGNGNTSSKRKGTVTFGAGNNIQATKASMLLTVQGANFTAAEGIYQAVGSIYSASANVTGPAGYALKNNATLSFVPSYEVRFYSYDGNELLKTQALDKGVSPSEYTVTYPNVGLNGYDHVGWTLTPGGTELVDLSTITTETTNLYAVRVAATREVAAEVIVNGQTKQYASFADALAAKGTDYQDAEGEHITIKLLKDATSTAALAFSNASLTLDMNGYTLEFSGVTKVFADKGTAAGRKLTFTSTADTKGNFIYYYQMAVVNSSNPADIEFNNLNISCTGYYGMYGDILSVSAPKEEIQRTAQYTFKNCQSTGLSAVSITGEAPTIPAVVRFENCQMDVGTYPIVSYSKTDNAVVVYVDTNSKLKTTFMVDGSVFKGATATVPAGYVFADSDGDGWYQAELKKVEVENNSGTIEAPVVDMTEGTTSTVVNNADILGDLESLTVNHAVATLKFLADALDSIGGFGHANVSISVAEGAKKEGEAKRMSFHVKNGTEDVPFNGSVEVTTSFTGESGKKYAIFHDDNGILKLVSTNVTADSTDPTKFNAAFTVKHFSDYVAKEYTAPYTAELKVSADTVVNGEKVEVNVNVTGNGVTQFSSAKIVVNYDPASMSFASGKCNATGLTDKDVAAEFIDNGSGVVTIVDYGEAMATGEGVYTLTFNTVKGGNANVTMEGGLSTEAQAANEDLSPVAATETVVTVNHKVTVNSQDVGFVSPNGDGTYELIIPNYDDSRYEYTVEATVGGVAVDPSMIKDNRDGTFTVEGVTGDLVITHTAVAKSFNVEWTDESNAVIGEKPATGTYDQDFKFSVKPNEAAPNNLSSGYNYVVTVTKANGESIAVAGVVNAETGNVDYTIPAASIDGDLKISVVKTEVPATHVTVTVDNPDVAIWVDGAAVEGTTVTVEKGKDVTLKLTVESGFSYSVTIGDSTEVVMNNTTTEYTIENVQTAIVVKVDKSVDLTSAEVVKYMTMDNENTMWLVKVPSAQRTDGKVYVYGNDLMLYSEKYDAYVTLVIAASAENVDIGGSMFKLRAPEGSEAPVIVNYNNDVNMSGNMDINDAQLVWNMYTVKYNDFSTVSIEKFLRADLNEIVGVDTTDAAVIVAAVKAG